MARTHILGFPRIGARRELKFAQEAFWRGESSEAALRDVAAQLRRRHWQLQAGAGLDTVATGDFAWYDQMLSLTALLGALPRRFGFDPAQLTLAQYFELARGNREQPAMEMTKWFDTNYHYLVPELDADTTFDGGPAWFFEEADEALAQGLRARPVLVGPVTYLWLSKSHAAGFDRLSLLPQLVQAYRRILGQLKARGIEWVQVDEPALCLDLEPAWLDAFDSAYAGLRDAGPKLLLATYFDTAADHAARAAALPVDGFHIDLVRAPGQLAAWQAALPAHAVLSAGVIDGRNIWRTDLRRVLDTLRPVHAALGDRLWLAPSCSLLHVPVSLAHEVRLDAELKSWLAFATEKLDELQVLARALNEGDATVAAQLAASDAVQASRRQSRRVVNPRVQQRLVGVTADMARRASPFAQRIERQREALQLPLLPTTTIGSFPQTAAIRQTRAAFRRGDIGALEYLERIRAEIALAVRKQEELGLDVLVHGEAERNDMVEYFGEQLCGYGFTGNGWVQSYGSRCVKPPVIYGDVYRPEPMTVDTTRYAQSLTERPMKGMLTGPITMLQWSFVRDDQPRATTARQLALAIRDEVCDLEQAGIRVIQIDEPALREGLPLRRGDWDAYLDWAVTAFRLSASGVRDQTQIHTHMCYAEFNDILPSIAALDADVITIETSRSAMELLEGFGDFDYPNEIGPGVYDIHSPRVPSVQAMERLLDRACEVVPPQRLWVNPDCGLKTRAWEETEAALANMVSAARALRERWSSTGTMAWKRIGKPAGHAAATPVGGTACTGCATHAH
ncbi:5-methyltetrahydropteroyltriglutamate--homocysteine S-methyltransferase [Cupriavidus oxalaticus]|uniref:5-methyltetrahydropteroyltriglutamate--homocysteine methyltransferase n=1 Tax=Cupriavidus oxalaticus TaxID=96344 RepID=A0A976BJ98_9BURK|nr:5-methyltetrahydropteroyltriglutamate--homocysteine S-methyltransferase [Cupriavidus oxalaticus]QRQ85341.1 5-methyltetrahydropteroyltriglutamate--homocysteine S-methyltransferase [Cupriavidus oxalaticus]QRQ90571.1 5-methyltetrahydropteroyltriglutamate--homocysteine S-methyltransferase [Cupriavidus oxalaticus]WQD85092.1 5-methyltetrahydropteroyltriglutamate--homocysteine S-methyltransferase [Cupriavidus oxalaticus]SPC24126.1 5-methyltetrahydropteroyltriglutamate-homocysteine S-methyltransfera